VWRRYLEPNRKYGGICTRDMCHINSNEAVSVKLCAKPFFSPRSSPSTLVNEHLLQHPALEARTLTRRQHPPLAPDCGNPLAATSSLKLILHSSTTLSKH